MQEYDVALKLLFQGSAALTMRELTGTVVAKWLDVGLPKVRNLRLDLLGETVDGGLVHVELQSGNDSAMPLRMAEYCLSVFRLFERFPRQIVLYVGEPALRMENELRGPGVLFQYRLIDIGTLDGDRLLESEDVGDNVIAILARLRDHEGAVRKIVERIAGLAVAERETALEPARTLLLTDAPEGESAGVLSRGAGAAQIDAAIRAVAAGLTVRAGAAPAALNGFHPDEDRALPLLTPREIEILSAVGEGMSNKEVARRLGISGHTVKFHLEAVFAKLDAATRAEAVAKGLRRGLIEI